MKKQLFEKRCKFSIRKFTLGVASVMIGATFFAVAPVLADQARVGSIENLPSELADLDKKASDEGHDFDKEAAAQNPGSAETTEGPQTEEELLAREKEKSEKPSNLPKELEDKLEKAEDNGHEVDKDQLAQDTGKLVPEDVAKTTNGELNYGATVKIKTPSGEGSGIVVAKDLVLTVSHNFIKDSQDGTIRKVVDNDQGDGDIYSISYPGLPDVKFSKKDIIHWDREGYLKGFKNDLALVRLRTVLENTPVEVTKKPVVKKIGDKLHVFGYPEGKLNPIVNTTVDFAEPYGEGVQGIGYQGGKPGASGGGIFDTEGKLVGVHQNGVVGKRSGGILFSPAQLKWIQDHMQGISSVKPADLEEKEKPAEEKPKEDKPAVAKPETPKTVTPEWQTAAKKEQQGTVTVREEKGVRYNQLSSTAQNDNGDKPALFEKQGLTVDANGNATVDLTFKDDSEKGKSRFGVFLKFKDTKNNVFVGYDKDGWFWEYKSPTDSTWYKG
ncbi:S1 family peptidase, partial [Streptococcus oralis]|uniref:S1 family peptidase n=1 Tax=Streptococcus oralis TaxID=1303 RepID=UPI001071D905